ncbi:uncharacterized protein IL334_001809 [Kwoniella shivajii]|uniref:Uncharacterized protein n=1 Tax=Kwoniella shivajii TaxID=564305 RepID=A0ABZ1CTL3_9TREE|nr:hypothetical protein IL334_001809 [Kwoniella shivajii]
MSTSFTNSCPSFASDFGAPRQFRVPFIQGSPSAVATISTQLMHDHLIPYIHHVTNPSTNTVEFHPKLARKVAVLGTPKAYNAGVYTKPYDAWEVVRKGVASSCGICSILSYHTETQQSHRETVLSTDLEVSSNDALVECTAGHVLKGPAQCMTSIQRPQEKSRSNQDADFSYANTVSTYQWTCPGCPPSNSQRWRVLDDYKLDRTRFSGVSEYNSVGLSNPSSLPTYKPSLMGTDAAQAKIEERIRDLQVPRIEEQNDECDSVQVESEL